MKNLILDKKRKNLQKTGQIYFLKEFQTMRNLLLVLDNKKLKINIKWQAHQLNT